MAEYKYKDDVFEHLENEFTQIQTCVGMYIGSKGAAGAIHLFKEIFNNSLDECANENSPADWIRITLDKTTRMLTIEDNGRGIPFDKMVEVCSQKHTGTKFGRKYNKESAGCNGVGLTVTVAFADRFEMRCDRGFEYKIISFDHCKLTEGPIMKQKKEKYGTTVSFVPSEEYLGEFEFKDEDVLDWLRHMSYIIREGIKLEFVTLKPDQSVDYVRDFSAVGLAENVKYLAHSLECDPIDVEWVTDECDIYLSFGFDKTIDYDVTDSYCNYVITCDGGYHEQACRYAITDYLVRAAKQQSPDHKYEVIPEDIRKGLIMAINCKYANVVLGGQTKTRVENKEILKDGKKGLMEAIKAYFNKNPDKLTKIINYLRQIAKVRLMSNKIKGVKSAKNMTVFEEAEIRDYYGLADRNHKGYSELIITEGLSAAGAIVAVRNSKYQAVYTTTGVLKNTTELSMEKMMQSRVPRDLIKILGCGVGKDFNINNLRFSRIILMQDADADGYNIKSLLTAFFVVWLPEIVKEGRVYTGVPPLYSLSPAAMKKYGKRVKGKSFLFDKHEFTHLLQDIIVDNVELSVFTDYKTNAKNYKSKPLEKLNKSQFKSFLTANKRYLDELQYLVKKTGCHRDILELVCNDLIAASLDTDNLEAKHHKYDVEKFKKLIEADFPEMTYDITESSLYGAYKSEDHTIIIDDLFIREAAPFIQCIMNNPSVYTLSKNKNNPDDPLEFQTIGKFLDEIYGTYAVDIEQRFKGLGEVEPELLFYSTLNPKIRKLVRLTMDDQDEALKQIMILRGSKFAADRRQMFIDMEIDDDDLDN